MSVGKFGASAYCDGHALLSNNFSERGHANVDIETPLLRSGFKPG